MKKLEMARKPHTSAETLALLAQDKDDIVRWTVAGNPHTSAETLALLAKDENCVVRGAVAQNPITSAGCDEILPSQAGN